MADGAGVLLRPPGAGGRADAHGAPTLHKLASTKPERRNNPARRLLALEWPADLGDRANKWGML